MINRRRGWSWNAYESLGGGVDPHAVASEDRKPHVVGLGLVCRRDNRGARPFAGAGRDRRLGPPDDPQRHGVVWDPTLSRHRTTTPLLGATSPPEAVADAGRASAATVRPLHPPMAPTFAAPARLLPIVTAPEAEAGTADANVAANRPSTLGHQSIIGTSPRPCVAGNRTLTRWAGQTIEATSAFPCRHRPSSISMGSHPQPSRSLIVLLLRLARRLEVVLPQIAGDLLAQHGSLHVGGAEVDAGPDAGVDDLVDRLREPLEAPP